MVLETACISSCGPQAKSLMESYHEPALVIFLKASCKYILERVFKRCVFKNEN